MVLSFTFAAMNDVYLLLGGNTGNRAHTLQQARQHIEVKAGSILRASALYETAAWGKTDQPHFLNQVLQLQTSLAAAPLLQVLLSIENAMGRIRTEKNAPRPIDIDILFFNNEVISQPGLVIPHPQLQHRRFVLIPLRELAPNHLHPVLQQNIRQLLHSCTDTLDVKKFYLP